MVNLGVLLTDASTSPAAQDFANNMASGLSVDNLFGSLGLLVGLFTGVAAFAFVYNRAKKTAQGAANSGKLKM